MPKIESYLESEASYWRRDSTRRIAVGLGAVFGVIAFGIVGYVMLGWSFSDALFMVVITISGVGFGEVRPLSATPERVVTMLVIAFGVVAVAYTVSGLLQLITEGELRKLVGHERLRKQIDTLKDHVIIAGFGRMGSLISLELAESGIPFIIIEQTAERVTEIEKLGYLYIVGDATEESVLSEAGLERAKQLVSVVPSDADNVFITLTAHQLAPQVQIIARAEKPSTQRKLQQAGANHVVMPATIGARRITSLLTQPYAVQFVDLMTTGAKLSIEMDEITLEPGSSLNDRSLRDTDIGRKTGVIVVAIKHGDGRVDFPAVVDEKLLAGDRLVLLGSRAKIEAFRTQFCT